MAETDGDRVISEEFRMGETGPVISHEVNSQRPDGSIVRWIAVPVCGTCGDLLEGRPFGFCWECGRKACEECQVSYKLHTYGKDCIAELLGLGNMDYKVLRVLDAKITRLGEIARLARATKDEVKASLAKLLTEGYVVRRGFVFSRKQIPSKGVDAAIALVQVFGKEPDVAQLEAELAGDLTEGVEA